MEVSDVPIERVLLWDKEKGFAHDIYWFRGQSTKGKTLVNYRIQMYSHK